ncbi:hypothetical protein ACP70R_021732 [Stipagrostis hirtigluma subsp. patula]
MCDSQGGTDNVCACVCVFRETIAQPSLGAEDACAWRDQCLTKPKLPHGWAQEMDVVLYDGGAEPEVKVPCHPSVQVCKVASVHAMHE